MDEIQHTVKTISDTIEQLYKKGLILDNDALTMFEAIYKRMITLFITTSKIRIKFIVMMKKSRSTTNRARMIFRKGMLTKQSKLTFTTLTLIFLKTIKVFAKFINISKITFRALNN
ncbi:hypothetical protein AN643_02280 [Candidatus Epulonipiscioides saccharophilum]|nr:hypothetical protein AN643_02280 [Epulopiscium sp. SCG-B10WGA-EpuloB]